MEALRNLRAICAISGKPNDNNDLNKQYSIKQKPAENSAGFIAIS